MNAGFRARTTLTFINISTLAFLSNSAGRGIGSASIAVVYTRQGRGSPCNPVQTCGTYHGTAEKRAAPRNIRRPAPITSADGQFTAPKKSKDQKRQKPADGRRLPGEVYTERRRSRHRLLYLLVNRPEKNACKRNFQPSHKKIKKSRTSQTYFYFSQRKTGRYNRGVNYSKTGGKLQQNGG